MSNWPNANRPVCFLSAMEMASAVRSRAMSATSLLEKILERIETLNPTLNAIVTLCADKALDRARSIDRALDDGLELGPLAGVPFTVKDSVDTAGVKTQRGSQLFAGRIPSHDATAVARLKAAGANLIAKTNLPEFSRWWETDNVLTGKTSNPWDAGRTPGGSSGGESAAISSGMSPLGIGTDVGISVRGPAHFTGIVGFKPTHGAIPLSGNYPPGPNRMWHIGPMARCVGDVALAYRLMRGPDGADGFAMAAPLAGSDGSISPGVVRVGWIADGAFGPVDPEVAHVVRSAAELLATNGCSVEQVRIPILEEIDCVQVSAPFFAETLRFLKPLVEGREDDLSAIAKRQLARPAATFDEHVEAEETVERLRSAFAAFFEHRDVLVCPVVPFVAPPHGKERYEVAGTTVETNQMMRATIPFNLTGLPALSVPITLNSEGLPIGVQLVGRWFGDEQLLRVAALLEHRAGFQHLAALRWEG